MTSVEVRCTQLAFVLGGLLACRSHPLRTVSSEAKGLLSSGCEKLEAGRPLQALADLDRAIQLDPESAEAHRQRAHCHVLLGQHPEALEDLDRALALGAQDAWTHYARGVSLREVGDPVGAMGSFTRALELDPGHYKSAVHRAALCLSLGEHELALLDLELALRITPATATEDLDWIRVSLDEVRAAAQGSSP